MYGMTLGEAVIRLSLTAVPLTVALAAAYRLRNANAEYARGWYARPLGRLGRVALMLATGGALLLALRFAPAILFDRQLPLVASAAALAALPLWMFASLLTTIDRALSARRHAQPTAPRRPAAPLRPVPPAPPPTLPPTLPPRQSSDCPPFRSRRLPNPTTGDIHAA